MMTEVSAAPSPSVAVAPPPRTSAASLFKKTEIDTRLFGMIIALAIIWIGFNVLSDGNFITPRNLWNLSVQSSSTAIMATGMVLIIVSRNIDLSIGSMLGFIGYLSLRPGLMPDDQRCRSCISSPCATFVSRSRPSSAAWPALYGLHPR